MNNEIDIRVHILYTLQPSRTIIYPVQQCLDYVVQNNFCEK